ncbi:MAG: hypothetical protein SF187_17775 [Deltaproteobacteria bacterium]|nr:hypothetical protein [Deltaproteobacteria bacterium]
MACRSDKHNRQRLSAAAVLLLLTASPGPSMAQTPSRTPAPTKTLPGGPVRIRVSPSGSIELAAPPQVVTPAKPAPAARVSAPAAPKPAAPAAATPAPVVNAAPRPKAPSLPEAPPRPTPTTVPTNDAANPFARVRLQGPVTPALAAGLKKLATPKEAPPPAASEVPDVADETAAPVPFHQGLAPLRPRTMAPDQGPTLLLPPARPFFVEGELEAFVVRPVTRRNFVGVGAGVSSIPNDANTLLNTFFISIEPQVDVVNEAYNWKLGLGAPLNLRLLDTRGAFEQCLDGARALRAQGGTQDAVSAYTGSCLIDSKDNLTQGIGTLRKEDWDETSDYAKVMRYFTVGKPENDFFLNISRQFDQSLAHGTVIRDYNANINFNTSRLGATMDFNRAAIGIQGLANDLVRPDVLGLMLFLRPFRPFSENVLMRSLSMGFTYAHGVNQPRRLLYEPGLFAPAFDQPIPKVDDKLNMMGAEFGAIDVYGVDLEAKVVRLSENDLKIYGDFQKMKGFGSGMTLGALFRYSKGQPATQALRARAELQYFSADYLPSYFDTYHDIFQNQYLPATYTGSNGLSYSPTKWQYLEAARGGKPRIGGYFEVTHSFLDKLTLGVAGRIWRPVGSPTDANFDGLRFPDYGPKCTSKNDGDLDCGSKTVQVADKGFTSLRLRAELPFRKFLQAFASYEVFSASQEGSLGAFKLDGDNEILFGGARLMLLPFLFFQAETRRYFFLQRVTNINLDTATVEQDQRYHANWTFAFSIYAGYEF